MGDSYASARKLQRLWEAAQTFEVPTRLPRVLVMTDPRRPVPHLDWPGEVGVIYRHFGATDRVRVAEALREATWARGHRLLIGADPELAVAVGADGVHFRRSADLSEAALWRARVPEWLITAAGVKPGPQGGPISVLDGLLVSSVFASASPSAGTPIGLEGLKEASGQPVPVYALGGVSARNVDSLRATGIAGVAGVDFGRSVMDALKIEKQIKSNPSGGTDIRFAATHPEFPGLEAELDLKGAGPDAYAATHTGVPRAMEGKGVGSALFRAMVEDARTEGYKVIPVCPFIVAKYKRKPDTQDTMASR